jgi:GntR family transcriptional regulator
MLPFTVTLRSGEPVTGQVIYAVTRAIVAGQLRPGDTFPSVRALSQELKINPNTAHKIVAELIRRHLLAVRSGVGTVVSGGRPASSEARRTLLDQDAERLVVDAKRAGLTLTELVASIRQHWSRMTRAAS